MEASKKQNIISAWLGWRFYQTPRFLLSAWKNYLDFMLDYFSIPLLLATLLAPWRHYRWNYPKGFDVGGYFSAFISNTFSRFLGMWCRLILIVFGIIAEALVLVVGLFMIMFWIFLPLIIIAWLFFYAGIFSLLAILCLVLLELRLFFKSYLRKLTTSLALADTTVLLNFEAGHMVNFAIKTCKARRLSSVPSQALFYAGISKNKDIQLLLTRLGLDPKKLKQDLKNYLEKQKRQPKFNLVLSGSFEATVLRAMAIAGERGLQVISEKELLVALAVEDEFFKKVLIEAELKEKDVEGITFWLDELESIIAKNRQFWTRGNLARLGSLGREWASGFTITLDRFSIDWTSTGKYAMFGEIIGHEKEINEVEMVLAKSSHCNALIVGTKGSGRKSIAAAVMRRAFLGESLPELNSKRLVELDLISLLAKIQDPEQVETLLDQIFREIILAGNVILLIDDLENFVANTVAKPGTIDISGILAKYLALPNFQFIGITSFDGLHQKLENNPSFLEYFTKVEVGEVSEFDTIRILQNMAIGLERQNKLLILYPAIREIVNLTARYLPSEPFPKKAIDMLEEAIAYVRSLKERVVQPHHVAKIISDKTQIPMGKMEFKEKSVLLNLEKLIHEKIIGQGEAVTEIAVAMRRARSGISNKKRPMGVFLFLGPTGVGKTETAKALADIYFGGQEKMIRLDMSEFQAVADIPRLLGSAGQVEQQGILTTPVRENPFSLVLLDEIEKAHKDILNLFLQVFDDGYVNDGQGRKVVFSNTIIICTSNAGAPEIFKSVEVGSIIAKDALLDILFTKGTFKPEFVNRFDATIIFHPLTRENLMDIVQLMFASLAKNLQEKEIELLITQPLKQKIVELSYKPQFGAREMRRVMQDKVESKIADALLQDKITRGSKIEINPENFEVVVIK